MAIERVSPSLREVVLRLVLSRLFLPLAISGLFIIGGIGYLGERNLETRQHQVAKSIARIVYYHVDQGGRILDAISRVAANSEMDSLAVFMKSAWQAYGYFETLYYLDENKKVKLMMPFEPRYVGLDMSNLPVFLQKTDAKRLIYSRPFISLRTGEPTISLVKVLSHGGFLLGELNLGLFQKEIINIIGKKEQGTIFILDQSGTLLAHPDINMVRQQVNVSNLKIFQRGLIGKSSTIYRNNGDIFLGSTARVKKIGWLIVNQIPVSYYWASYAWILGLLFLVSLAFWLVLTWGLRKQIQHYVIDPLEQLSCGANALAAGDFGRADLLSSIPKAFTELHQLITNFQSMSANLRIRQIALQESEERYRGLFDRVPIGLYCITKAGYFLDANPAVLYILGYPDRETLRTVNLNQLVYSPATMDTPEPGEKELPFNEMPRDFEAQIQRYDGTIIWVRFHNETAYHSDTQQTHYEGSMEDITLQKLAEKAMRQAKDELELLVKQRTAELVILNNKLRKQSLLDSLTGIANRRYFNQFLEKEWKRGLRKGEPVAIIMLDIDFFKYYNDLYGHQAGDHSLRQVAGILRDSFKRSSDLVARYGGEEFIAVLSGKDTAAVIRFADEIRAKVEALGIKHEKSPCGNVITVSLGIATMVPRKSVPPSTLIEAADQALYRAKREGRNRVIIADNID